MAEKTEKPEKQQKPGQEKGAKAAKADKRRRAKRRQRRRPSKLHQKPRRENSTAAPASDHDLLQLFDSRSRS